MNRRLRTTLMWVFGLLVVPDPGLCARLGTDPRRRPDPDRVVPGGGHRRAGGVLPRYQQDVAQTTAPGGRAHHSPSIQIRRERLWSSPVERAGGFGACDCHWARRRRSRLGWAQPSPGLDRVLAGGSVCGGRGRRSVDADESLASDGGAARARPNRASRFARQMGCVPGCVPVCGVCMVRGWSTRNRPRGGRWASPRSSTPWPWRGQWWWRAVIPVCRWPMPSRCTTGPISSLSGEGQNVHRTLHQTGLAAGTSSVAPLERAIAVRGDHDRHCELRQS